MLLPYTINAQLILADTNMVCKGKPVRLFVNPKLFSPPDFCLDPEGERNGLYYFSTCRQVTFDDAYAFARLMKGNLVTVNDAAMNGFVARLKPAYIKWIGFFQDEGSKTFKDPPDPASGFVWMSGVTPGFTRWAAAQPDNYENSNPGKNVIMGCTNVAPPEWCDVNKNDGHKYIAIIETKLNTIPPFPAVQILWEENGSTNREIIVNPTKTKYYKVKVTIDGTVFQDSIKISVPEIKADFSKYGGCGNPFFWNPVLISNSPKADLDISWTFASTTYSGGDLTPKLQSTANGDVPVGVKVESISCAQTVFDTLGSIHLEYPFDSAKVFTKELKLNEIFELKPVNNKTSFTYSWQPPTGLSDPKIANPKFMAVDPIAYTLTIDDGFGCKIEEKFQFTIDPNIIIYMPDAFSPNNDNVNDVYKILTNTGFYGHLRRFTIVNRWSLIVYDSIIDWQWDGKTKGKDAPVGLYHYVLQYEIEKVPYEKSGSLVLIR